MPDASSEPEVLPGPKMQDGSMDERPSDAHDSIDSSRVGVDDAETAPPTPATIESSHLRLWLNAEVGVDCKDQRVSAWADLSPDHRDATLQHGQLGPQCQVSPTPHIVNGVDLPYFSGPETADAGALDETLDVDLGFLQGSNYTLFVVERRSVDDNSVNEAEFVLGTTLQTPDGQAPGICPSSQDTALAIGYVYYHGGPQFVEDQSCTANYGDAPLVNRAQVNRLVEHGVRFDSTQGHQLWMKGTLLQADTWTFSLTAAQGGAIGRAFLDSYTATQDQRFKGDIAEVIIYDTALSDADLIAVEAYLQRHWNN
jgi:hypothetical protein